MSYSDDARIARLSLTEEEEKELLQSTVDDTPPSGYLPPAQVNENLARVDALLKEGKKKEARAILSQTHRYAVKNPAFWWRVAKAAHRRNQAIRALHKVVDLRPRDQRAQYMINKLEGKPTAKPKDKKKQKPLRKRIAVDIRLLVFALLAAGVILLVIIFSNTI